MANGKAPCIGLSSISSTMKYTTAHKAMFIYVHSALSLRLFGIEVDLTPQPHVLKTIGRSQDRSKAKSSTFVLHFKMKAANLNFNLIDSYLELLNTLSPDSKLELIARLSDSLKGPRKSSNKPLKDLYGAFKSKKSADEIIDMLRGSRNFSRNTEQL